MGPWPLFNYHTSFSPGTKYGISFMDVGPETFKVGTKCGISFMEVGPQIFELLNKMWSHGITEFRNDGRTWQIQYSPTFSKRGYDNTTYCRWILDVDTKLSNYSLSIGTPQPIQIISQMINKTNDIVLKDMFPKKVHKINGNEHVLTGLPAVGYHLDKMKWRLSGWSSFQ